MYISGQLGMDPANGQLVEGGVQAQTRQVMHERNAQSSVIQLLITFIVLGVLQYQSLFNQKSPFDLKINICKFFR